MDKPFVAEGKNPAAPFTLKLYRGEGMVLVAMNWKLVRPTLSFVGFAIEYKEPGGGQFYALNNRLGFPAAGNGSGTLSTLKSPIQKFRWVHFPRKAELPGEFVYRVTPVYMDARDQLSYGEAQEAALELRRETRPGKLNVAFTQGFVSSQAFVDRFGTPDGLKTLIPAKAAEGLSFKPTHPKADEAYAWMGFEARDAILAVLDEAIADTDAQVRVVAYDLNQPEVVTRLVKLGKRLKIIIDDSKDHGGDGSAETLAAAKLAKSAGKSAVKRQHMRSLQHNKTIVVDGPKGKTVVCGSTNFSWRAFYVQSNNAMILHGAKPVDIFLKAFDAYWNGTAKTFGADPSAEWNDLGLKGIDAKVAFSPHAPDNALLASVADDVEQGTTSSLFYSLAFLYETPGPVLDAILRVSANKKLFVYGISDKRLKGGLYLKRPGANEVPVYASALAKDLPEPFSKEPSAAGGTRMHHKFLVVDFDKPTARVYLGSYNFSSPADISNGENLLLIQDPEVATSYMVEALRIFDHYHFRVAVAEAEEAQEALTLAKPPRKDGEAAWWEAHYQDPIKIRDRELFGG